MPDTPTIVADLDNALAHQPLREVVLPTAQTVPPVLSYVVNFPRLALVLQGQHEMLLEIHGRPTTIALEPGQAAFFPPNVWNKPTWALPVTVAYFLFGRKQTGISIVTSPGHASESAIHARKTAIRNPISGPAQKILEAILELHHQAPQFAAHPQLVTALVRCLYDYLTDEPRTSRHGKAAHLFEDVCTFLQENFQHEITREFVARQFAITPSHLSRLFRTQGDMKFSQYLAYVRIDRAKFMLARYDTSLGQIARRCGFADASYFCRTFKNYTRKTPTEYRNSLHQRNL